MPCGEIDYLFTLMRAGECGCILGKWPEEDCASINHPLVVRQSMWHLLSMVKQKASSYLLEEYKVMEGMEKQQKNIERLLLEISDIIEDAEEKGAFQSAVAAWLKDLEKVAYEVNDIFDEFRHEALQREAKKKGHHRMLGMELRARNPIVFRYRMGKKLCRIVQTIEVLVTKMNAFGFTHMKQAPPSKQWRKMDPILFDSDKDVVRRSRDKEKNKIVEILLHEASNMDLVVLPIIGFGGIGKTTLAQLIYNDPEIERHFELQRWCHVSVDFDFTNIANNICQTKVNDQGCEKALKDLQCILSGKRYLIVLDDVRNRDEAKWGELMTCLKQGGKGSAVLATTRDAEVARIMKMGVAESCYIEKLSPKHLKEIVQSRAFSLQKPNSDELDGIVDTIVDRCAGNPLASKSLGSLLSTKTSLEVRQELTQPFCLCRSYI